MSDQSGIILQKKIKAEISPQIGEIQYVTDTKELAVNSSGQIKYRNNSIVDYRVLKGTTAPDNSLGLDGDFYIRENSLIEYFKFNSVWKERFEGKDQAFYLGIWETKLSYPSNGIQRDGFVPLSAVYIHTSGGIVSKGDLDAAEAAFTSSSHKFVAPDGSNPMIEGYSPQVDGDVITREYLESGQMLLIPTTIQPEVEGIIWNNNGNVEISIGFQFEATITGVLAISPVSLMQKIVPSDGGSYNYFGTGVASNSTKVAITSFSSDALYIYNLDGTGEQKVLIPEGLSPSTVDMNETNIVVGCTNSFFIFDSSGANPIKVVRNNTALAMNDSKIVIGDYNANTAYIYDLDGTNEIVVTASEANGQFGRAVAINSTKILVGSPNMLSAGVTTGAVWTFALDGTGEQKIVASNGLLNDYFGINLQMNETNMVIGAHGVDGVQSGSNGGIYIYSTSGSNEIIVKAPNTSMVNYGEFLSISDSKIVVGLPDNSGNSGWVEISDFSGDQLQYFYPDDSNNAANYGKSSCWQGDKLYVGAPYDNVINDGMGAVYYYDI